MKKILCILVFFCSIFISNAYSDNDQIEKTNKQNLIFWEATPTTLSTIETQHATMQMNKSTEDKLKIFDETMVKQVADLILQFDSLAGEFLKKSKHLTIDTMDISIAISMQGQLYIVSGETKGAVSILLKKK